MEPYRNKLSPREKRSYDSVDQTAQFLVANAQTQAADPAVDFTTQDIQALKSNIFSLASTSPMHGEVIRRKYIPTLDKLESAKTSQANAAMARAKSLMEFETQKLNFAQRARADKNERDSLLKLQEFSDFFSENMNDPSKSIEDKYTAGYSFFFDNPKFMVSDVGKQALTNFNDATMKSINPEIPKVASKVLTEALESGSTEAVDEALKYYGATPEQLKPLKESAKQAMRIKSQKEAAKQSSQNMTDRISGFKSYLTPLNSTTATDDDIKTRAQVILNGVKDLGLSNNPKILSIMQRIEKNIKDMGSVVPKESGTSTGSRVSKAGSSARSTLGELMLELGNVNSTIPGAMQFNRYDPSIRRRPSTLNSLGIPSR